MLHTPQSTPLLLPLTPNKSRRCTNPVFFNPVLILLLPVQSIQAGFLNHHKKRFLLVWSSLNYFPVHQPAATNFMHLQSTYTPHLQHIQSEAHMESSRTFAVELYCGNSQRIKAVGYFRRRAPSWMFDRILNATLPFTPKIGNIPRNVWRRSPEFLMIFPGIFGDIPRNVWRHSWEYNIPHIPSVPRIPFPVPVFLVWYIANLNMIRFIRLLFGFSMIWLIWTCKLRNCNNFLH